MDDTGIGNLTVTGGISINTPIYCGNVIIQPNGKERKSMYDVLETLEKQICMILKKLDTFEERIEVIETHIKYMPDGAGYFDAKTEFETLQTQ